MKYNEEPAASNLYLVNLVFISCLKTSKPLTHLESKDTSLISIVSLDIKEKEIVLYSEKTQDLSLYVLRKGETQVFYSLLGVEIQAGVPLKINLPARVLNKKRNHISLFRLEVADIWQNKNE